MEMHTRDSLAAIHGLYSARQGDTRRRRFPFGFLRRAFAAYARRRQAARLVLQLEQFDDRLLRDMGIERDQIAAWVGGAHTASNVHLSERDPRT